MTHIHDKVKVEVMKSVIFFIKIPLSYSIVALLSFCPVPSLKSLNGDALSYSNFLFLFFFLCDL